MADQGLTSQDLRLRAQVQTLRKSDNGHHEDQDPMDLALRTSRQMAAQKLIERSASEATTAAIEAENARIEAQIKQRQLVEQSQTQPQGATWQEYIIGQVGKLEEQLADTRQKLGEQQIEALERREELLKNELQRLEAARAEQPTGTAAVKQQIEDAKSIVEMITSPPAPPLPSSGPEATLQAWLTRTQLEQRRWELERQDRRDEALAKLELEKLKQSEELTLRREQEARRERFFTEAGPKLLALGEKLLTAFAARGGPGGEVGVVPVSAETAPTAPAGASVAECPQCHNHLYYRPSWGEVICQRCGAAYRLEGADEENISTRQEHAAAATVETVEEEASIA